jgi:type I restriction enzyme S subunit
LLGQKTLEEFERIAYPIDQTIENNETQTQTLLTLRDNLLPKLLSGQIRLPQAEKLAGDVL